MALTLIEAAKLNSGNVLTNVITELYAGSSSILQMLPFQDVPGGSLTYNREEELPGVGFRGVNESYTASTGVMNPLTEVLKIAGGDLDVDKFILKTMGANQRAIQERLKTRALALRWTKTFIKGDSSSEVREFDGLQTRFVGDQKIAAGATANGTPLSLAKLDQAIDQTLFPTHLIMNKSMSRRLTQAARLTTVGGHIEWTVDTFGNRVQTYNGLPILTVDLDDTGTAILPFSEAATSGTATATSIYIIAVGDDGVMGLQNGGLEVTDLGELDTAPVLRTRIEWYSGFGCFNGRCGTRLFSISDAAVTV